MLHGSNANMLFLPLISLMLYVHGKLILIKPMNSLMMYVHGKLRYQMNEFSKLNCKNHAY